MAELPAAHQAGIALAIAMVGEGYIFGATGWICSLKRREQQAAQYPEHIKNILGDGAKWDGKRCWDCATFTRRIAKEMGIALPSGATSQYTKAAWAQKGAIATLPQGVPVFVYRQSGGVMQHTGFALGDGTCIHARGTAYGVVRQSMSQYAWTHWASMEISDQATPAPVSEAALYQAIVYAPSGNTVRVRHEPGGKVLGTLQVGTVVDVYAESPGYLLLGYQGGQAYMQSGFLQKQADNGQAELPQSEAYPTLRLNDYGADVARMQDKLYRKGYRITIDADFGGETLAAVQQFQRDNGLTADGICGAQTWAALSQSHTPAILYTITIPSVDASTATMLLDTYPEAKALQTN